MLLKVMSEVRLRRGACRVNCVRRGSRQRTATITRRPDENMQGPREKEADH